jgi:hypothetical protein
MTRSLVRFQYTLGTLTFFRNEGSFARNSAVFVEFAASFEKDVSRRIWLAESVFYLISPVGRRSQPNMELTLGDEVGRDVEYLLVAPKQRPVYRSGCQYCIPIQEEDSSMSYLYDQRSLPRKCRSASETINTCCLGMLTILFA